MSQHARKARLSIATALVFIVAFAGVVGLGHAATTTTTTLPGFCPIELDGQGGHEPAKAGCCSGRLACSNGVSPGLVASGSGPTKIRRNVVAFVLDDHGYCQNGFIGGRCARTAPRNEPSRRCSGRVCSNATWLSCSSTADCPPAGCGESPPACLAADPAQCASGESCVEGYCVAPCSCPPGETGLDGECGCGSGEICVDGLCSPRASCTGNFQCARGIDKCLLGGAPCPVGSTACTCSLDQSSSCTRDSDCNDKCVSGFCARTPAPCGPSGDCGAAGDLNDGLSCTASTTPLRLNDLSCRYRLPGEGNLSWRYDLDQAPAQREQVVYTPQIDQLAREGATFPRHRGNGNVCVPGRGSLLTGRSLRHRDAARKNNGDGMRQCQTRAGARLDMPVGCDPLGVQPAGQECWLSSDNTGRCDRVHTIAWWLENPGGQPAPAADDFFTLAAGKLEIGTIDKLSFDSGLQTQGESARFALNCAADDTVCNAALAAALDAGKIPDMATCDFTNCIGGGCSSVSCTDDQKRTSVFHIMGQIRQNLDHQGKLAKPFFLWHAQNLPHEFNHAPQYFHEFYAGSDDPTPGEDDGEQHLARTSLTDSSLEALIDELKRTCVCGADEDANGNPKPDPSKPPFGLAAVSESLWDNTTIILVQDNAFLLPQSKANETENSHRGGLVINAPIHRAPESNPAFRGPKVLDEQTAFSSHADILPTVLDYAGQSSPDACNGTPCDNYPLNQSLRELVEKGMNRGTGLSPRPYLRPAFYGHRASFDTNPTGSPRYIVPRPGVIGLCETARTAGGHVRPCLDDADCGSSGGRCKNYRDLDGDGQPDVGRRCANRPQVLCDDDRDCAEHVCCVPGTGGCDPLGPVESRICDPAASDYQDFDGLRCVDDRDCVPKGVCRPVMLKVVAKGTEYDVSELYDLNLDPDQSYSGNANLFQTVDPNYLGSGLKTCPYPGQPASLAQKLACCLQEFWQLEDITNLWTAQNRGCPAVLRDWTPPPPM